MDSGLTKETVDLSIVRYDKGTGLVPVVVQNAKDGTVLMVAYANREALKRTLATGQAWFWSRSRQDYWRKGATSGNVQTVEDVRVDCDGDTVLYLVHPAGPACHTGELTCFYRSVSHNESNAEEASMAGGWSNVLSANATSNDERTTNESADNHKDVSSDSATVAWTGEQLDVLVDLWGTIATRYEERPDGSYTTYLFTQGIEKIGKKVGEEAVEVALASLSASFSANAQPVVSESADLLYHLLVLWRAIGVSPDQILQKLADR